MVHLIEDNGHDYNRAYAAIAAARVFANGTANALLLNSTAHPLPKWAALPMNPAKLATATARAVLDRSVMTAASQAARIARLAAKEGARYFYAGDGGDFVFNAERNWQAQRLLDRLSDDEPEDLAGRSRDRGVQERSHRMNFKMTDPPPEYVVAMEVINALFTGKDADFVMSIGVTILANMILANVPDRDFDKIDELAAEIHTHINQACRAIHTASLN